MDTENDQLWNEVAAERAGNAPALSAEKPIEAPAAETSPVEATPQVEEATKPDPLAEISAKLAEFENKFSQRLRNIDGHIGGLTNAQKQIRERLEAASASAANTTHAPTQSEIQSAAQNPAEWEKLKEDWPEWAAGTEKFLELKLKNSFDATAFEAAIKKELHGQTAAMQQMIIDSSLDVVLPDWKDECKTPEFKSWLESQPESIQALAASTRISDAAKMLRAYDESRKANPANQIIEQRKQKLEAATSVPRGVVKASTTKSWEDMNETERWEFTKRERAKRSH